MSGILSRSDGYFVVHRTSLKFSNDFLTMHTNTHFSVGENSNYLYTELYKNGHGILALFITFYSFKHYKVEHKIKANYFESQNYS